MKILVVCQYYYPEPFRVDDVCKTLAARGHEVCVVTGEPNYPEGFIYKGYENHQRSDEFLDGVTVHRCPIIPRKTGILYRFLNYFSYPAKAKKYIKHLTASDGGKFDAVFVYQLSPVMMAEPAICYKKKFGVPVILYCLDLWPESLVAGGVNRTLPIYRIFHRISKRIYRKADRIFVTSRMFRDYLKKEFSVADEKIAYLPQYAEGIFEKLPYKEQKKTVHLLFAGNIGDVQSVDTVIEAAEKLQDKPVLFHIVGGGTGLKKLQELAQGLNNVIFYDRRPLEEMPEFYAKADAMIITLKADPVLSLTLPGKIQSYMAAGKPIIGAINGETSEVIRAAQCGYCGRAEDADELAENILRFLAAENKRQMGENARSFYENYFEKDKFMDTLETALREL